MPKRTVVQGTGPVDGAPRLVIVGDRVFSSGLVSDRPGGLESEAHRIFSVDHYQCCATQGCHQRMLFALVRGSWMMKQVLAKQRFETLTVWCLICPVPAFSAVKVSALPGNAAVAIELEAIKGGSDRIQHFESGRISAQPLWQLSVTVIFG